MFWCFVSKDLSWSIVEIVDYFLYLFITHFIKVCSFWKESSDHTICMLIGSSLVGFIWFSEVYRNMECLGDLFVSCMFCSIIPSNTLYASEWKRLIDGDCGLYGMVCCFPGYAFYQEKPTLSLDLCSYGRESVSHREY